MEAQLLPVEDSIDSFTNAESERRKQLVGGSNSRAVLATCVTCLGPFLFGYSLGFTSPVLTAMKVSQSDSVFSSGLTEVMKPPHSLRQPPPHFQSCSGALFLALAT